MSSRGVPSIARLIVIAITCASKSRKSPDLLALAQETDQWRERGLSASPANTRFAIVVARIQADLRQRHHLSKCWLMYSMWASI